jgi:hypothetical protein
MPKLKNLICQVQWAKTGTPFSEYGLTYGDGVAECFITVPQHPQPFRIQLRSTAFIHQGLAAFVHIDGKYQSNRNRVNLLPPKKGRPSDRTEINFILRQKEHSLGDEYYLGREWRFDDHNIGNTYLAVIDHADSSPVSELPEGVTDNHFDYLGSIVVAVYRCVPLDDDDGNLSTTSSGAESDYDEWQGRLASLAGGEEAADSQDVKKRFKSSPKATEQEEHDLPFGMGIFDGPGDFYRPPPPPHSDPFGGWSWPPQLPGYSRPGPPPPPGELYPDDGGWYSYYQRHGPEPAGPPPSSYPRHAPPPPQHPPLGRRVHFDHGPPPDPYRYRDDYVRANLQGSGRPHTQDAYRGWDGHSAGYGPPPHESEFHRPPPVNPHAPPPASHFGQPPYGIVDPGQHMPPYSQPHYTGPAQSQYPAQAGPQQQMPNIRWSQGSGSQGGSQKPGSLDPAKEENNTADGGWGSDNKDGWDAGGEGNTADSNNNNNADSGGWGDGDQPQDAEGDWNKDQNQDQGATGDWNDSGNDQNNANAGGWDSSTNTNNNGTGWNSNQNGTTNQNTSADKSWETPNQNNSGNDDWGSTTKTLNAAGIDQSWGSQAQNMSSNQPNTETGPI